MLRLIRSQFAGWCVVAGLLVPMTAYAQVLIPPSIIQRQAERDNKAAQGTPDPAAEKRAATKDQHQQIETLRTAALGDDPIAATAAVHSLRNMGEVAKPVLRDVVGKMLARDRAVIVDAHGLPSAGELRDLSDKIMVERKEARENIDKLSHDDDSIPKAHKHYDSLKAMWEKLHGAFAQADAISIALSRRGELVNMWRDLMPADKQYSDDAEAKLAARAEREFGFTPAQMASLPEIGQGDAPKEPVLRDLWLFRASRRITAYNASISKTMTAGEKQNFQFVNTYREYLGLLPYELDPRLVQAARDHSQEMITLKYFAHDSPVAANKSPWDRIKNAGYKGGSGENIAMGAGTGEKAFWMWFDSPGHHQNMASKGQTALGVGNVGVHWTQDFGSGHRLMLSSPEDRKEALGNIKSASKNG
ncbi:MAG TPA: CAP domain-containing protein [Tepidisphaeraceae bacterium]|nr:CAP domain-containing protein [Tepidisphaeraceae bacterium]